MGFFFFVEYKIKNGGRPKIFFPFWFDGDT
jgi:hypothetical protein